MSPRVEYNMIFEISRVFFDHIQYFYSTSLSFIGIISFINSYHALHKRIIYTETPDYGVFLVPVFFIHDHKPPKMKRKPELMYVSM